MDSILQSLSFLEIKLQLLAYTALGSIIGLIIELSTMDARRKTILFRDIIRGRSIPLKLIALVANLLVGVCVAYMSTPFIIQYFGLSAGSESSVGFLVGIAGLSIVRAYIEGTRSGSKFREFVFTIVDFFRPGRGGK